MEGGDRPLEIGQPGSQRLPAPLETRFQNIVNDARQEGERPDLWKISLGLTDLVASLNSYEDYFQGLIPDWKRALTEEIGHIRDAFDIVAHPFMDEISKRVISGEVYGNPDTGTEPNPTYQGEFTLTPVEKRVLTKITTAARIPDNPGQLTYSYSSIPRVPTIVQGNVKP